MRRVRFWFCVWWCGFASVAPSARADAGTCGESFTPLSAVQGDGDDSPLLGEQVTVCGVVTGDFRGLAGSLGALDGVFIQDRVGDGDPRTSDALFLYFGATLAEAGVFAPGTSLRASGTVQEYDGETQLAVERVEVCGDEAQVSPLELSLPTASASLGQLGWVADLEAFEGMLLTTDGPLHVADVSAYARHGELTLVHGAVPWSFTQGNLPDVDAFGRYEQSIAQRTLVLDDGSDSLYAVVPSAPELRVGSEWAMPSAFVLRAPRWDAEGSQGGWRALALELPVWDAPEPKPSEPTVRRSDTVRIVAVNLHNLFKDGGEGAACYPSFDAEDCRGETTAAARRQHLQGSARQAAAWGADVIAASEVQNDFGQGSDPTWVMWIREVNEAAAALDAPCQHYMPVVPEEHQGGDAIAVALAYCADSLSFVGSRAPPPERVDAWGPGVFSGPNSSRLPLAGTWARHGDDRTFSVVANHFKSRSPGELPRQCPNPQLPDCDGADGQGYYNAARVEAARAASEWLSDELNRGQPVLVAGDLNSYPREAPLDTFDAAGYALLTSGLALSSPSYVYNSRLGVLDHLLISRSDLGAVASVGVFAVNVGRLPADGVFSDHDAVFVDLLLTTDSICNCDDEAAIVGTPGADVIWGTPGDDAICALGGDDVVFGLGGEDCIDGGIGDDWVSIGDSRQRHGLAAGEHVVTSFDGSGRCEL